MRRDGTPPADGLIDLRDGGTPLEPVPFDDTMSARTMYTSSVLPVAGLRQYCGSWPCSERESIMPVVPSREPRFCAIMRFSSSISALSIPPRMSCWWRNCSGLIIAPLPFVAAYAVGWNPPPTMPKVAVPSAIAAEFIAFGFGSGTSPRCTHRWCHRNMSWSHRSSSVALLWSRRRANAVPLAGDFHRTSPPLFWSPIGAGAPLVGGGAALALLRYSFHIHSSFAAE